MKILVTDASEFIGSCFRLRLVEQGDEEIG